MKVYKYPIPRTGAATAMPKGAKILHFDVQADSFCVWALVDPDQPLEDRLLIVVGTGHDLPAVTSELVFINSTLSHGGKLVFHCFEHSPIRALMEAFR